MSTIVWTLRKYGATCSSAMSAELLLDLRGDLRRASRRASASARPRYVRRRSAWSGVSPGKAGASSSHGKRYFSSRIENRHASATTCERCSHAGVIREQHLHLLRRAQVRLGVREERAARLVERHALRGCSAGRRTPACPPARRRAPGWSRIRPRRSPARAARRLRCGPRRRRRDAATPRAKAARRKPRADAARWSSMTPAPGTRALPRHRRRLAVVAPRTGCAARPRRPLRGLPLRMPRRGSRQQRHRFL